MPVQPAPAALPPGITLRRARAEDAVALAQLGAQTFTDTFGHLYPRADLDAFLAGAYCVQAQRRLLSATDCAVWLLERGDEAIGHAAAGPCTLPHPEVVAGDGELKRLYVLKSHQNTGLGAHLMHAALNWLLRSGSRTVWLGVWSQNLRAQRFYSRYGFARAGEYLFPVGQTRDVEWILRRPALS